MFIFEILPLITALGILFWLTCRIVRRNRERREENMERTKPVQTTVLVQKLESGNDNTPAADGKTVGDMTEHTYSRVDVPDEYEIEDDTFIADMICLKSFPWRQYEVFLAARPYGWENMKFWADYMIQNDLGTVARLNVAAIAGAPEKNLIEEYRTHGSVCAIPELQQERGVLGVAGISKALGGAVEIVWFNQLRRFRLFAIETDDVKVRRYVETVIRQTFGTPDEMKLARPIKPEADNQNETVENNGRPEGNK